MADTGKLVIIRGLPGSGKSTLAKTYAAKGFDHFEADQYFMVDGEYRYNGMNIGKAHEQCLANTSASLYAGRNVVVSNTFTQYREVKPYLNLCVDTEIITCTGEYVSVHGVPELVMQSMRNRWEKTEDFPPFVKSEE